MKTLLLGFFLMWSATACNDMSSRQETADKWKPILVQVNAPLQATDAAVIPTFGSKVRLDFYVIAPEGEKNITAAVIQPDETLLTFPLTNLTLTNQATTTYPGLELLRLTAETEIPSLGALAAQEPNLKDTQLLRFRYGLELSAGGRSVPIYGDFPVYASPELAGANNSLRGARILMPEEGATVGTKVQLEAEVDNPGDEPVKVGWYVSAGELQNRRSISTEWELPGPGTYTAILTVRGKQSRNSQLVLRQVTVP